LITVTTSAQHPNHERGKKNRTNECCETKGQENVALNKAYEHHSKPERRESNPEVKRKNFFNSGPSAELLSGDADVSILTVAVILICCSQI
jgi:hypothetical protein